MVISTLNCSNIKFKYINGINQITFCQITNLCGVSSNFAQTDVFVDLYPYIQIYTE